MAAIALPTHAEKRPEAQIIDLSSDDEEDDDTRVSKLVSRTLATAAPSRAIIKDAPDHAISKEARNDKVCAGDDEAVAEEVYSDTSSFVGDLFYENNHDEDQDEVEVGEEYVYERCTPEESAFYKQRLRQVTIPEFVKEFISSGAITAKKLITAFGTAPPQFFEGSHDNRYYRILGKCLCEELTKRQKLPQYNTFDDVVALIKNRSKIMVITGAGVSSDVVVLRSIMFLTSYRFPQI